MELARITGTLLIDPAGVYDPADVNNRMLLGLRGTIGEVELHVMAGRLQEAKRAAASRGELRTPLPVGYVHDEGDVIVDPDAKVQAAVADVFTAFTACGTAYGVWSTDRGRPPTGSKIVCARPRARTINSHLAICAGQAVGRQGLEP